MALVNDPKNYTTLTEKWQGTNQDDTLIYDSGPDIINGLDGIDTLSINLDSGKLALSTNSAGITYLGDITLIGIEKIAFTNGPIMLTKSGRSNSRPSGEVVIKGALKVGETLSVDASSIKDDDNSLAYTPVYNCVWQTSLDGFSWESKGSADRSKKGDLYAISRADAGKQIRALLTFYDGYGNQEIIISESLLIPDSTYIITPSANSANEGETLLISISTKNVTKGTRLYWSISGIGIEKSDFASNTLRAPRKIARPLDSD